MANTTFNIYSNNQYISGYVEVIESNPNTAGNYSTVTTYAYLRRTNNYSGTPSSSSKTTATFKIDGQTFTINTGKVTIPNDKSYVLIASASKIVYHNSDGSKNNVPISFSLSNPYGNSTFTVPETTGYINLDRIARSSSVSCNNGNIGSSINISINRADSSFTHNLTYAFGNLSGTIANNVGTNYSWTIPTSFYGQIPNSNSGTGTITCRTYLNGTLIGTSTCSFTANVVNSNPVFPSNPITYLDSNSSVVAITGNNQHIVRSNSNLKVTYSGATAQNSASISRYEITFNGSTQTKYNGATIDYGLVNSSQNLTVSVTAIDSRGNSTTVNKEIIIFDWVLPSAIISAKRVNNYEDETKLKVETTISSVNEKNAIESIQYRYKKTGDAEYSSFFDLINSVEATISLDKIYAWDFQFVIKDKFGTTTYNVVVSKGIPIMFIDTVLQAIGINCFPSADDGFFVSDLNYANLIPIGSVKLTSTDVNPSTYLGGSWNKIASGSLFGSKTLYLWERVS